MKRNLETLSYTEMYNIRGGLMDEKPKPPPKEEPIPDMFIPEPTDIWIPILL